MGERKFPYYWGRRGQKQETDRLDVLDGLRGLAILLVVIFHVWQLSWWDFSKLTGKRIDLWWLPQAGFLGVELFFVISGFCIAYPFASGKTLTWREFYWRRVLKVLPSYFLALIVCAVFFDDGTVREKPVLHLLTHLTFTHNGFFETYYSTLGPAWSLAVEVQFYLLFPLLHPLLKRWPYLAALGLALIAVLWRRWAWGASAEDGHVYTMRLNQLPGCLDLFACGIAAAYLTPKLRERLAGKTWVRVLASLLAVAALAGFWWLYRGFSPATSGVKCGIPLWQAHWRLPIGLLSLAFIAGGSLSFRPVQRTLANPPARFLALISYNLYLWHKPLADALRKYGFPAASTPDPHDDLLWQGSFTGAAIGLAVLVATILTFAVERPILAWGKRRKTGAVQ